MRAYFFVNTALSGIQKGLQVAHCVAEMLAKYKDHPSAEEFKPAWGWATNHKTIVVLEGGFHKDLEELNTLLWPGATRGKHSYPWANFFEDRETMNGMMTAVGIILPERIYEAARIVREENYVLGTSAFMVKNEKFTAWEIQLITLINSCPLAR